MQHGPAASGNRAIRWIAIIALAGLILRIQAAAGSLWVDEAWSAVYAHDAGGPFGIFQHFYHDNNHHLNSLWLQWVGLGAPPLLARALSVLSGTAAIFVAGLIGLRRGVTAGILTALLFAMSPVLVTLGSEARGYAPMTLMALIAVRIVDRWLDGDRTAEKPVALALCFYIGTLFQLTMLFVACAVIGWPFLTVWRREGFRAARRRIERLFGLSVAAILAALLLITLPPATHGVAYAVGDYQPFTWPSFRAGVAELLAYTVGAFPIAALLPAFVPILLILSRTLQTSRLVFYWLAIVAFPVVLGAIRPMNAGHPRYYLLIGLALLLLIGEALAAAIRAGGWRRAAGVAVLALIVTGSAAADLDLIETRRGDPGAAIRALAARAPAGTGLLINRRSGIALMRVAAAEENYPLSYANACPARAYLFVDWYKRESPPAPRLTRCGVAYGAIAAARSRGLSGQNWTLYERMR